MTDNIRQQIVDKVDTRLKAILTANGYQTNLGSNVFEWRETEIQQSELPALIWRDTECDDSAATAGMIGYHDHTLRIEMVILAANGTSTPDDMRKCIADVTKAIGTDQRWSGLAMWTNPISTNIEMEQKDKFVAAATMTVAISYRTKAWDPYTQ